MEFLAAGQALPVPVLVVLVAAVVAAVIDVWKFRVHNLLTLPLLVSGIAYHGFTGGLGGATESLLGGLFGFGVLVLFYLMGGMGAGDVKLMAAVGAWLGIPLIFYVFIASSLAAGLYAIVLILVSGRFQETWLNLWIIWQRVLVIGRHLGAEESVEVEVNRSDRRSRVVPFAAMMAVGLVALLVWSWLGRTP